MAGGGEMMDGQVRIEVYEIDGKCYPESDQWLCVFPHRESEGSDFGGDSENFVILEIGGHRYTVCSDHLVRATQAIKLLDEVKPGWRA